MIEVDEDFAWHFYWGKLIKDFAIGFIGIHFINCKLGEWAEILARNKLEKNGKGVIE